MRAKLLLKVLDFVSVESITGQTEKRLESLELLP